MTDHKWRKDRDGAESCEREGCTVRRSPVTGMWQKKRGGHWRSEREPIPPCAGKEVGEERAAPSPLEVVREALDALRTYANQSDEDGDVNLVLSARAALATLEEAIRADELAMAITQAEDEANNHPLVSTSMRLRVRLSKLRGKAESLEKWEASIRKDERSKAATVVDGYARRETKVSVRAPLLAAAADIRGTK